MEGFTYNYRFHKQEGGSQEKEDINSKLIQVTQMEKY